VVTCKTKHRNNFEIISEQFYFTCNYGLMNCLWLFSLHKYTTFLRLFVAFVSVATMFNGVWQCECDTIDNL